MATHVAFPPKEAMTAPDSASLPSRVMVRTRRGKEEKRKRGGEGKGKGREKKGEEGRERERRKLPTQMEFEGRSTCKVLPTGKGLKGGVVAGSLL